LIDQLRELTDKNLNISMTVQEPDAQGFGMLGSGLFIINPPWTLAEKMQSVMPYLTDKLAQFNGASFQID
jgi:23S rRNA (adenine2030-N6)-methyltransferase